VQTHQCHRLYTGRHPGAKPEPDLPLISIIFGAITAQDSGSVAKFLRSFLQEFGKKQWMVTASKDHQRFLAFITNKMVNVKCGERFRMLN